MSGLLLIQPPLELTERREHFATLDVTDVHYALPNIGIGYLLAVAQRHCIPAQFLDMQNTPTAMEDVLRIVGDTAPHVVGFTGWTAQMHISAEIARRIKEQFPETLTCVGGPHPTAIPQETLDEFPSFDFVVVGEGEATIVSLFERDLDYASIPNVLSRGKGEVECDQSVDLNDLPFPAWNLFRLHAYHGYDTGLGVQTGRSLELPVSTSRGCFGTCTFCWRQFGRHRRHRSVDSVLDEIEADIVWYECSSINFFDETFIDNAESQWSVDLFNGMLRRGIQQKTRWACEMRVDVWDTEIFKLMKEAGCYFVFFGVESGNEHMRIRAGKAFTNDQIIQTVRAAHDAGINCAAAFILGLPGETEETMRESIQLAHDLDIYSTTFPIAVPFPGTAIRRMAERGFYGLKILTNDWRLYDKQYPGVMDSNTLDIDTIRKFQKHAYNTIPQKKMRF